MRQRTVLAALVCEGVTKAPRLDERDMLAIELHPRTAIEHKVQGVADGALNCERGTRRHGLNVGQSHEPLELAASKLAE